MPLTEMRRRIERLAAAHAGVVYKEHPATARRVLRELDR